MCDCCRTAKSPKSCVVNGSVYSDGDQFSPNCSQLCTCQDGRYACSTKCPQELRAPSSVHCQDSQLVTIKDRCCKEWVCPRMHSVYTDELASDQFSGYCVCVVVVVCGFFTLAVDITI